MLCLFSLIDVKFLDWQLCLISGTYSDPWVLSAWGTAREGSEAPRGRCCHQLVPSAEVQDEEEWYVRHVFTRPGLLLVGKPVPAGGTFLHPLPSPLQLGCGGPGKL